MRVPYPRWCGAAAALVCILSTGCGGDSQVIGKMMCTPLAATEQSCSDGLDEDCDGYVDCLDTECEGQPCGDGYTCQAGACLKPCTGGPCLPELPRVDNLRATVRGDTAIIEYEPVPGARDYRIYVYPDPSDILVGQNGEVSVRNAIYRCAGDFPSRTRRSDPGGHYDASLETTSGNGLEGYHRKASESTLGYVYLTPGADRQPVYRMADPDGGGGYHNADWVAPPWAEANSADYVVGTAERDRLLGLGYRDDGVAFYAPTAGDVPVYRRRYKPGELGRHVARFYVPGPEQAHRQGHAADTVEVGERFRAFSTQQPNTVALRRIHYLHLNSFDVLAAGEPRFQKALEQGNQPFWSLTWPGITEKTTFVVEALDAGCPFPNGYIGPAEAPQSYGPPDDYPSITLDQARLSTGEVYINGQHDPANRPKPIARGFIEVTPKAKPVMDFYESFDPGAPWEPFTVERDGNNGVYVMRNAKWAADFSGCTENLAFGPLLGQLILGFDDGGSSCNVSISPRNLDTRIGPDSFIHVRMASDVPSTLRRYPQIMITTTPIVEPGSGMQTFFVPIHNRLGPPEAGAGDQRSIIVQPFGLHDLQVQFCDLRGWGVGTQCPMANIYGYHVGDYVEEWSPAPKWLPVPVLPQVAGHDRPVLFDVYASTRRVYVFIDEEPAGCADLPPGRMPEGPVTVAFRAVGYHLGIDDPAEPDTGFQYLRRYSLLHSQRTLADLGVEKSVPAPAWDEKRFPCGGRWYGGG